MKTDRIGPRGLLINSNGDNKYYIDNAGCVMLQLQCFTYKNKSLWKSFGEYMFRSGRPVADMIMMTYNVYLPIVLFYRKRCQLKTYTSLCTFLTHFIFEYLL